MIFSLMSWALSAFLVYSCLSLAVSAWKREGRLSRRSGMSLLVGVLEAASVAGLFRLVVPWGSETVALWVVAVAALAAAVAGVIIRWPELSARPRSAERLGATLAEESAAAEQAEQVGHAAAGGDAPERGIGNAGIKRPLKKSPKKPKKEPGKAAVAGHAGFLAAVVALSLAAG